MYTKRCELLQILVLSGLPFPLPPIYTESPHQRCEHSLYSRKVIQIWKSERILEKANALYVYVVVVYFTIGGCRLICGAKIQQKSDMTK